MARNDYTCGDAFTRGTTLRAWIAGQAMQGILAAADWKGPSEIIAQDRVFRHVAECSVRMADAMMDEMEKPRCACAAKASDPSVICLRHD